MITTQVTRIPPQSGRSFKIKQGQTLRVVDPLGQQVSDLFAFDEHDLDCRLSSGRSLDYASRIYLTTNDILYANNSKPMFTIVADTVGLHDFLLTPCSQEMFEILYQHKDPHPSCFENLFLCFKDYGVSEADISTTFNIFMNVHIDAHGKLTVGAPLSKADDHIDLRAEMDMLCGLTACSAEASNNGRFKPIDFMILG